MQGAEEGRHLLYLLLRHGDLADVDLHAGPLVLTGNPAILHMSGNGLFERGRTAVVEKGLLLGQIP